MTTADLKRILLLVARRDPAAADELDRLADKLRALAARLRAAPGTRSIGGVGDRVRMQLRGPDGSVRHDTDPTSN